MASETTKKVSEKQREWSRNYDKKAYTYRSVKFKKEELEAILAYCEENNLSINGFMRETLMKAISKDEN